MDSNTISNSSKFSRLEKNKNSLMSNDQKQTIYVHNLNDRVSLSKLNQNLNELFIKYGDIKQIKVGKSMRLKGQAFIVFQSIDGAQEAIKNLQDHALFNKPMKITYAKNNSDIINDVEIIKQRNLEKRNRTKSNPKKRRNENDDDTLKAKKPKLELQNWRKLPPNHILLLQNITEGTDDLQTYFEKHEGFINIRLVKVKKLAFIEYENENFATQALQNFDNNDELKKFGSECLISYAKR